LYSFVNYFLSNHSIIMTSNNTFPTPHNAVIYNVCISPYIVSLLVCVTIIYDVVIISDEFEIAWNETWPLLTFIVWVYFTV